MVAMAMQSALFLLFAALVLVALCLAVGRGCIITKSHPEARER
jgi:hypothetical protein